MALLSQVVVSGLTLGSLYALVGLGFVVIFRATRVVNFAQGEMMMLGAILALYFYSDLSLPYSLAFVTAVVLFVLTGRVPQSGQMRGDIAFALAQGPVIIAAS